MQSSRVLGIGLQVEQGVLSEAGRQAQLLGVGALDGEEESVAGDLGTRGVPHHHGTVVGNVLEMDICWSIGLCKRCQPLSVMNRSKKHKKCIKIAFIFLQD